MNNLPVPCLDELAGHLLPQQWIFAKTMPHNPHWYTLRKHWPDDAAFVQVVQAIRDHGFTERYQGRNYQMLALNGMKYWTMGAPLNQTILINRKVHVIPTPYDAIAPVYDGLFATKAARAEDIAITNRLAITSADRVLDIGCGTGLLLHYCQPGAYLGIDPSSLMLDALRQRFPQAETIACRYEDFSGFDFTAAISLFGAASYIHPAALVQLPKRLAMGGRYLLMFYRDGYTPYTHTATNTNVPFWPVAAYDALPGTRTVLGNFVLVEGSHAK